jgi:hypothetical protein
MKIKIAKVIVVCLLAMLIILTLNKFTDFATTKVYKYPTSGPSEIVLSEAISRYKHGEIPVVDLSKVTTFSWDRVYIFGPYTERSKIAAVAGKSWQDSCFTTIEFSDGMALLLFIRDKQVVDCIEFPENEGDFTSLASYESGFSFQEARFIMDERGKMAWLGDK